MSEVCVTDKRGSSISVGEDKRYSAYGSEGVLSTVSAPGISLSVKKYNSKLALSLSDSDFEKIESTSFRHRKHDPDDSKDGSPACEEDPSSASRDSSIDRDTAYSRSKGGQKPDLTRQPSSHSSGPANLARNLELEFREKSSLSVPAPRTPNLSDAELSDRILPDCRRWL